jgi:lipid-A-disaccharide synthase
LKRVAPTLTEACAILTHDLTGRIVVCVAAGSIEPAIREMAKSWTFPHIIVSGEAAKADAFAAMDVAIACSGTVTTELAAQGAPVVLGYKLGWITWAIARLLKVYKPRYIALLNVAAGREVAPEFVQTRLTPKNVAAAAERLLSKPEAMAAQRKGQAAALKSMAGPGRPAAEIAAERILRLAANSSATGKGGP